MDKANLVSGLALACLLGLLFSGCSEGAITCSTDADCGANQICYDGVCMTLGDGEPDGGSTWDRGADQGSDPGSDPGYADPGADPGGDPGSDPGSDPGADPGGDPGGDTGTSMLITPGSSVGPVQVSQSQQNFFTLGDVRNVLGELGQLAQGLKFTMSFREDKLWVAGIETNDNQQFDANDHIISVSARSGLNAATSEGLGPGSTFAQVRAQPLYASPDHAAILPQYGDFAGGKMDFWFHRGLYIAYNEQDVATSFMVIRSYQQAPNATINPSQGSLTFGGTTISFGDGYQTGSKRDVHQAVLGQPDWGYRVQAEVETDYGTQSVWLYMDSYRILGMEFIGGDDTVVIVVVDRLLAGVLYPPFHGTTPGYGNTVGSTKAQWESELGAPVDTFEDPGYEGIIFIYQPSADHKFAIMYTNNGASQSDMSVILILNYMTAE